MANTFEETVARVEKLGFHVVKETPANEWDGRVAYMKREKGSQTLLAQVEEISAHDVLINGEDFPAFEDWFKLVKR